MVEGRRHLVGGRGKAEMRVPGILGALPGGKGLSPPPGQPAYSGPREQCVLWLREPALSVRGGPSSPSFPGLSAGPRSHRPPAVQFWGLCLGQWGVRTAGAGGAEHRGGGEGPWACCGHTEGARWGLSTRGVGRHPGFAFPACEGRGRAPCWAQWRGTCWWPSP